MAATGFFILMNTDAALKHKDPTAQLFHVGSKQSIHHC
jgi:hypothetical protein